MGSTASALSWSQLPHTLAIVATRPLFSPVHAESSEKMIPKRFEIATVLLLLSPLSSGFGLWLIFQAGILLRSNGFDVITVAQTGVGVFFFILGFPLFFTSI